MRRRAAVSSAAWFFVVVLLISPAISAATLAELQQQIDTGRFDQAAEQSQAYLDRHPGNRDARFIHARALAGQGRTDDAIMAFESLAGDYPLRPEPANNLAVLYAEKGAFDQAKQWLDTALATQPAYAVAHRNLGDIYTALAESAYKRALGHADSAATLALTLLDRLYYAQESVASDSCGAPASTSARTFPAASGTHSECSRSDAGAPTDPARPLIRVPGVATTRPPLRAAGDSSSIMQTIRAWALAWSSKNIDAYATFYAEDFVPDNGMSREQWLARRSTRLERSPTFRIRIEAPRIQRLSGRRAQVDFVQHYDSPRYSDRVDKRLILEREGTRWRIARETSVTPGS